MNDALVCRKADLVVREPLVPLKIPTLPEDDEFADFFAAGKDAENATFQELLPMAGAGSVMMREALSRPDQCYRLVKGGMTPIEGSDGLFRGVTWNSGADGTGVKEMAQFAEVGQAAKIASTFFSQGMLIYIACELNDIKKGIADIQEELFQGEVSRMKGCIRFAGTALRHYRQHREKTLLFNAIQSVETEIDPLLDVIMRRLRKTPTQTSLLGMGKDELKKIYDESLSAVVWLLKGMVALAVLYSVSDPEFGKNELSRLLRSFLGQRNNEILNWLKSAGGTLAQKGYGSKSKERIVSMGKAVEDQVKVLSAPSSGLVLTGRQLQELQERSQPAPVVARPLKPDMSLA